MESSGSQVAFQMGISIVRQTSGQLNAAWGFNRSWLRYFAVWRAVCSGRCKYIPVRFGLDIHVSHARCTPPDPTATHTVPASKPTVCAPGRGDACVARGSCTISGSVAGEVCLAPTVSHVTESTVNGSPLRSHMYFNLHTVILRGAECSRRIFAGVLSQTSGWGSARKRLMRRASWSTQPVLLS